MPPGPRLCTPSVEEILGFCAEDPVERVYLEDVARRGLGGFTGVAEGGRLTSLCHVGANIVPSGIGCSALAPAAVSGRARMIIGEQRAVDELWEAASPAMPSPREDRPGQPVYVLDEAPEPGDTGLRAATRDDLDLLIRACAKAHETEVGVDPLRRDARAFRRRTQSQIDEGRSWIWRDGSTILFKAEASAWTRDAVQLQQVWVDPLVRCRGYAQRAMRDLCGRLLARVPRVCLFVRPNNAPAIRVYEAIGMRRELTYRSLIF
jgi:uncharacterized protein